MDIKIKSINVKDCYQKEKFNIPFSYSSIDYEVTVYLKDIKNIDLECSTLYTKKFEGEYVLNGIKLIFYISICLEKYYLSTDKYDSYFSFYGYREG